MSKKEIGGKLPLIIDSSQGELENYQVYGASGGVGEQTENLWDLDSSWENSTTDTRSFFMAYFEQFRNGTRVGGAYMSISADGEYSMTTQLVETDYSVLRLKHNGLVADIIVGSINGNFLGNTYYTLSFRVSGYDPTTAGGIKLENIMLTAGSTAPTSHIPYGYKLPLTVESGETKCEKIAGVNITPDGVLDIYGAADAYSVWVAQVKAGETYTVTTDETFGTDNVILGYFTNYPKRGDITIDKKRYYESITFKALYTGYVAFRSSYGFEGGVIKASSDIPIYIGSSKLGEEEYLDYATQKVYKRTAQLFNPAELVMVDNYYIDENGEIQEGAGDGYTQNYFNVTPNEVYSFINFYSVMNNSGCRLVYYDAQGNFISRSESFNSNSTNNKYTFTTPNNCYKFRVIYRMTIFPASNTTIVQGSVTPDPIPPYYNPTDPPALLPEISLYEGKNTLTSTEDIKKMIVTYGNENISTVEINNTFYDINDIFARGMIADEYNNNLTYTIGDFCYYCGFLYRCINNCSGNWNSDNWEQTTLANILKGFNITIEEVL